MTQTGKKLFSDEGNRLDSVSLTRFSVVDDQQLGKQLLRLYWCQPHIPRTYPRSERDGSLTNTIYDTLYHEIWACRLENTSLYETEPVGWKIQSFAKLTSWNPMLRSAWGAPWKCTSLSVRSFNIKKACKKTTWRKIGKNRLFSFFFQPLLTIQIVWQSISNRRKTKASS